MKKKRVRIFSKLIVIGAIILFILYVIDMKRMKNNQPVVFSTWGYKYTSPAIDSDENGNKIATNVIELKDGKINDESIIERFIEEANSESTDEKTLIIRKYTNNSEKSYSENILRYTPYIEKYKEDEIFAETDYDEFKEEQGKFTIVSGDFQKNVTLEFSAFDYDLKRKVEDGNVVFYLKASHTLVKGPLEHEICKYSFESSNYKKEINLNFYQRKDLGIDNITKNENSNFNIFTYGGDVSFTFDTDLVYTFENALQKKVVTEDKILAQARMDSKYGICKEGFYSDGGSVEYLYDDYTILKFNTLDGRKDLVIGKKGQILNDVNDLLEEISEVPYTFKAKIEEVKEHKGKYVLLVDGLDENEINYRSEYWCSIGETTNILDKDKNKIEITDLKENQIVSITYTGGIKESYPAQIGNVLKVQVVD